MRDALASAEKQRKESQDAENESNRDEADEVVLDFLKITFEIERGDDLLTSFPDAPVRVVVVADKGEAPKLVEADGRKGVLDRVDVTDPGKRGGHRVEVGKEAREEKARHDHTGSDAETELNVTGRTGDEEAQSGAHDGEENVDQGKDNVLAENGLEADHPVHDRAKDEREDDLVRKIGSDLGSIVGERAVDTVGTFPNKEGPLRREGEEYTDQRSDQHLRAADKHRTLPALNGCLPVTDLKVDKADQKGKHDRLRSACWGEGGLIE